MSNNSRFLTHLALDASDVLSSAQIVSAFQKMFSQTTHTIKLIDGISAKAGSAQIVDVDGCLITLMFVDQPLPQDAWEISAKRSLTWPGAAEAMSETEAHIVLALLHGATNHSAALAGATAISLLSGALATALPVKAVIFTESEAIAQQDDIIAIAKDLGEHGQIPSTFWMTLELMRSEPLPDGSHQAAAITTGLRAFTGREVEFEPSSMQIEELGKRVIGLSGYLMTNGPVLADGDTVGLSPTENIRVRHLAQGQRAGIPIYSLSPSPKET